MTFDNVDVHVANRKIKFWDVNNTIKRFQILWRGDLVTSTFDKDSKKIINIFGFRKRFDEEGVELCGLPSDELEAITNIFCNYLNL